MNAFRLLRIALALAVVALFASTQVAMAQNDQIWIGASGTPLDWNTGTNWSPITTPPDIANDQIGVINNGGVAFLNSAATTTAGGLELGRFDDPSGGTGRLEIRNGGSLVVAKNGTTNGAVLVGTFDGGGFTGELEIQPGGSLTTSFIDIRGGDSSVVLDGSGGSAATLNAELFNVSNDLRLIGSNANLTTDILQLFGGGTIVAEITGASHSAINASNFARLSGSVELDFNGHTPTVGDSWTLIQAGGITGDFTNPNVTSNASLGPGQKFILSKTSTQANVSLDNVLTLNVDRAGAVSIENESAANLGFTAYSIGSASGSLSPGAWTSLSSGPFPNFQEANPSANQLGEIDPQGSATFNTGSLPTSLGNVFVNSAPFGTSDAAGEDLTFSYQRDTDGQTIQGIINYTGTQLQNNLVMSIDITTGDAVVTNDSDQSVSIDSYTIESGSFSLLTTWDSLDDQAGHPDWQEASPTTARLSELNPSSDLTLNPGETFELDGLWNTLGLVDVADYTFQFRETTLGTITGVVEFVSPYSADFDLDGDVDGDDLTKWQADYGVNGGSDANGDGVSDGKDLLAWQRQFGSGVPLAAAAAVPEPTSLLLLATCALALVPARRRS